MSVPRSPSRFRRWSSCLAVTGAVGLALATGGPAAAGQTTVTAVPPTPTSQRLGPVHTAGRWLRDAAGRAVIVHGLQVAHKTIPYAPPPASFDDDDARHLADLGFDAVRVAWFWKGLEPTRGVIDTSYLDQIRRQVSVLSKHGIYALVEFHQDQYNESVGGAGFPDWATRTDGLPSLNTSVSTAVGFDDPAQQHAFDNLNLDTDHLQEAMAHAWSVVAGAITADHDLVLGWDLYNEPYPGTQTHVCGQAAGCPEFDRGQLQPLQGKLAAAVRTVDTSAPVYYEPTILFDFGAKNWFTPPPAGTGPVGFAFHDYCLPAAAIGPTDNESSDPAYPACGTLDSTVFDNAEASAAAMGAAPLFDEYGDTQDLAQIQRVADLADDHMDGWLEWAWKDWIDVPGGAGSGALFDNSDDDSTFRATKAATLTRPYPQLVAGTPTGWHYDAATADFTLGYTADPAVTAPSEVFVPVAQHYPGGYRVAVSGAKVTSQPCSPHLTLATLPGATSVSVHVYPGACS